MLQDKDPVTRGYAARVTGMLDPEISGNERILKLLSDSAPVSLYLSGKLITRTVSEIAGEALHKQAK